MLPIIKDFIRINKFSRTGTKLKAKRGIVMHYTASPGAPAKNIGKYFAGLAKQNPNDNVVDRYAGAQYSVDRISIYNNIPSDEVAYHCGSATYTAEALSKLGSYPNNSTVGIEMCIEKDGSIHEDTFQNAADLVAYLIKEDGWPEAIFTHKGVVGWKDCPLPWIKKPSEFVRFKKAVADRLRPAKVSNPPSGEKTEKVSAPVKEPVEGETQVDSHEANAIISYLGKAWYAAATKEEKKEIGRLADVLRIASGQPKQNG